MNKVLCIKQLEIRNEKHPPAPLTSTKLTSIVLSAGSTSTSIILSTGEGGNLIGAKSMNLISKQHPPPLEGLGEASEGNASGNGGLGCEWEFNTSI